MRWVKSSQGSRRGTCDWITSLFFFVRARLSARAHDKKITVGLAVIFFAFPNSFFHRCFQQQVKNNEEKYGLVAQRQSARFARTSEFHSISLSQKSGRLRVQNRANRMKIPTSPSLTCVRTACWRREHTYLKKEKTIQKSPITFIESSMKSFANLVGDG